MRNQQQRRAEPGMLVEQIIDDRLAGRAIEIAGRLVGQQQRRPGDKGAGDRDALLLAAGKLPRIMPQAMPEPDPPQRRLGHRERIALSGQFERDRDILARRHRRQQVKALEHDPDMMPPHRASPLSSSAARSCPATMIRPALGRSMPAATIIRLDFPDPDGPTSATVSPGPIASEMPRKISTGPAAPSGSGEPIIRAGRAAHPPPR